jgi:hypothetical protein
VKHKRSEIGLMMNDELKIEAALEIEAGKTYVIEIQHPRSEKDIKSLMNTFTKATGAKAIVLVAAKIARSDDGQ